MTAPSTAPRRRLTRALAVCGPLAVALLAALWLGLPGPGAVTRASSQEETRLRPWTEDSVPATRVTMFGSSPQEAPQEAWGIGQHGGASTLVRYVSGQGWSFGPPLLDATGAPLEGFELDQPESFRLQQPSPLAGVMTPDGSSVIAGTVPGEGGATSEAILVREPGGSFRATPAVPSTGGEALLKARERLLGLNRAPMIAALREGAGHSGALVVPVDESEDIDSGVLHWDGTVWTREPIEIPARSEAQFEALAIGASSPANAWLLARLSASEYPAGSVALFRRHLGGAGETPRWQLVSDAGSETLQMPLAGGEAKQFSVPTRDQAQVLDVTSEGVWVDGLLRDDQASGMLYFKPEGEGSGRVLSDWCTFPAGAPAADACQHKLSQSLPSGFSRSFAWANPAANGGLGELVISGFPDGASLRLEGTELKTVLSLGGDAGASYGATFASPLEGWLGKELLPVHLTLQHEENRLAPWPVPFSKALLALAPQPEAPVGAISSQALAVGDKGEVARYLPGEGWEPETLLGPGGRRETPRLRAVAWPTPGRAYAVGDEDLEGGAGVGSQMWLWRGETGLWERDPAAPANFRGNLLGIAFDPNNSARGYAVGQAGVLLSFGKSWTQEPEASIPSSARGGSFTSIAFSGSAAIVAYRKLISRQRGEYEGGLIVNQGAGWEVDQGAARAMNGSVPWAVAGLPDGGAAFTASASRGGGQVFERQSAAGPWQAVDFPGNLAPGSLALFREGGALRAVASGGESNTFAAEKEAPPATGFPPNVIKPYPIEASPEHGVIRQTATGWSDEEHELNDAKQPPGEYAFYDTAYQPDPVSAVLVDPTGAHGWAVGGVVDTTPGRAQPLDTADVYRYPAEGVAPLGVNTAPLSSNAANVALAIGGGSQCAAPCASRAETKIGPDVWLSSALGEADAIGGVRAFYYTGSRVTTGETAGPATQPVPYRAEEQRYAEILGAGSKPAYALSSPTDLDSTGGEANFEESFKGFDPPLGNGILPGGPKAIKTRPGNCAGAHECAYYSMEWLGGQGVRVLALDDSTGVGAEQLSWLRQELEAAARIPQPAIVIGHDNLAAQIAAHQSAASEVARVIVQGHASAYFFDAQEQNTQGSLRFESEAPVPSFGSGTLGYVNHIAEENGGFIGESGFLLVEVNPIAAAYEKTSRHFPVSVKLIPNVAELAIEAKQGTLLRRSQVAQFEGLARRPRSGDRAQNSTADAASEPDTNPYISIPSVCVGSQCSQGIFPEYEFSSSDHKVGVFVQRNTASTAPNAVLDNAKGEPVLDPAGKYGLFCALGKGTTTVTLTAGGHSFSLPVTVQAGSLRQPCGTLASSETQPTKEASVERPPPPPAAGTSPASAAPVVPLPAPPSLPAAASKARTHAKPPFFAQSPTASFVPPFVPVPVPTPARPTPPSGTSAVTSPVEAPQREEEDEAAPESVSAEAVAYRPAEHEPTPVYVLGVVLLAAFAGASLRGRPGRRGRDVRIATATISTARTQRRMARGRRSW